MKKTLSFFAVFMLLGVFAPKVWAYDFSATAPNGQTLYYSILTDGTGVGVVWPNSSATTASDTWYGFTKPTGNLVIPSTVTYNGITYTVKIIGTAFYQCTGLTQVIIPGTITDISNNAFNGCTGLTLVSLTNGLSSIGQNAFRYCTGLTSITIPQSVTFIGDRAFNNCSSLISVAFNADSCTTSGGRIYPSGGGIMVGAAFHGCDNITNVTFGNNVTIIPKYLCKDLTRLTSVTIPNSVISIDSSAFYGCSGLTSVTIGNNVTSIGENAFNGCSGLTSVTIPSSVTSIGPGAFCNCRGLTSVTISNSVTSIGQEAFLNCSGLTSVTIPNSVTSIDNGTFYGCSGLTSITIPNSVTSIGDWAFSNCSSLTSITIPNSVTSIGDRAFDNCSSLTSVTIPDSVTYIGNWAFRGTSSLSSITLPNTIDTIRTGTFALSGLTSVTLPNNVTSVFGAAFYSCTGLTEIHSLNHVAPQLGTYTENGQTYGVFDGVPSYIPVYIPCGSLDSYSYSNWNYFSNLVQEEGFAFTATSADEQQGTVQILTMPTCTSPQAVVYASANSGYHFDHWSDNSTANPYSLTVTEDLNLVAYFAADGGGTEGIDDIDAANIRIYSEAGRIVVEGTTDEVNVYDMTGRSVRNDNLPAGVYMVKVGNLPARKVVVMR